MEGAMKGIFSKYKYSIFAHAQPKTHDKSDFVIERCSSLLWIHFVELKENIKTVNKTSQAITQMFVYWFDDAWY